VKKIVMGWMFVTSVVVGLGAPVAQAGACDAGFWEIFNTLCGTDAEAGCYSTSRTGSKITYEWMDCDISISIQSATQSSCDISCPGVGVE
jgi:hypothetical protein